MAPSICMGMGSWSRPFVRAVFRSSHILDLESQLLESYLLEKLSCIDRADRLIEEPVLAEEPI